MTIGLVRIVHIVHRQFWRHFQYLKSGVLKSKTEYRWCDDCNKIQICFLGIGDEYDPDSSDMPTNLKRKTYLSESDLILKIKDLESFKSGFFFFLTKRARKLPFIKRISVIKI